MFSEPLPVDGGGLFVAGRLFVAPLGAPLDSDQFVEVGSAPADGVTYPRVDDPAEVPGLPLGVEGGFLTVTMRWPRVRKVTGVLGKCGTCLAPAVTPFPKGWTLTVENATAFGLPTRLIPHTSTCAEKGSATPTTRKEPTR
jgi:hypothetical protein